MVDRTHRSLSDISGGTDPPHRGFRYCAFYLYFVLEQAHVHTWEGCRGCISRDTHGGPAPNGGAGERTLILYFFSALIDNNGEKGSGARSRSLLTDQGHFPSVLYFPP